MSGDPNPPESKHKFPLVLEALIAKLKEGLKVWIEFQEAYQTRQCGWPHELWYDFKRCLRESGELLLETQQAMPPSEELQQIMGHSGILYPFPSQLDSLKQRIRIRLNLCSQVEKSHPFAWHDLTREMKENSEVDLRILEEYLQAYKRVQEEKGIRRLQEALGSKVPVSPDRPPESAPTTPSPSLAQASQHAPASMSQAAPVQAQAETAEFVFRKEGRVWFIRASGREKQFEHVLGFRYLYHLAASVNTLVNMFDLVGESPPPEKISLPVEYEDVFHDIKDPDLLMDEEYMRQVDEEIERLERLLADPEALLTSEQKEKKKEVLDKLKRVREAAQAVSGQSRAFRSEIDRVRSRIWNAINLALDKLREEGFEELADHFKRSISCRGKYIIYISSIPWKIE